MTETVATPQVPASRSNRGQVNANLRILSIVAALVVGALLGYGVTRGYGENFSGAEEYMEGIGVLHRVPMPEGVITLEQVRKPWIGTTGADDFFRVFVNSYLLLTNEPSSVVLGGCSRDPKADAASACPPIWNRALPSTTGDFPKGHSIGHYLLRGWNHVIVEVENYKQGYCVMGIDLEVNGVPIDGFVGIVPPTSKHARRLTGNPATLVNALCDRRIYQFYLE